MAGSVRHSKIVRTLLLAGLLGAILPNATSHADTIYLKSGISISVTRTQEKDGQIEYWVANTRYTIGKDRVLKIEKGDAPVTPPTGTFTGVQDLTRRDATPSVSQHDKVSLPGPSGPKQNEAYWTELRSRIMAGETIDNLRLAEIEIQHDNRRTADAFFLAGTTEIERGHPDRASGYFERALQAMPDRVDLLQWNAVALARSERYADAARALERANALEPNSAEVLRLLGIARYNADRTADAIAAWKRAQELSPDPGTATLLRKAARELQVEEKLRSKESRHFTLHYQGERTPPELQRQVLAALETGYQDVSRQLSYEPRENIIVILYTQKEFTDITDAPSWSGGLNDGKLRIPIGGVTSIPPGLERVLRHELTHSFVHSLGGSRCPTWLQEGLAQLMEPRSASMYAHELGSLFRERKAAPFSVLEHSFTRFSDLQAQIAYAESLAAVEYLRGRYGMGEIVRMLESIGSGVEPETALRNSTGMDYAVLQERIGQHLTSGQ
jgi:tetratricopeptide (TPR) repeat protein